jgi:hypothetical protein
MSIVLRGLGEPTAIVTRGLGAGLKTPQPGGAVVEEAEWLLTDIAILEDLVADVEAALAPTVETMLAEATATIETASAATTDVAATSALTTEIAALEALLAVEQAESPVTQLDSDETPTTGMTSGESLRGDLTASDGSAATIESDDDLSGR